jgi:histidinol dehydrogenase
VRGGEAPKSTVGTPESPFHGEELGRRFLVVVGRRLIGDAHDSVGQLLERGGDRRQFGKGGWHRPMMSHRGARGDLTAPGSTRGAQAGGWPDRPEYHRVPVLLTPLDLRGVPVAGLAGAVPRPAIEAVFPSDQVREILEQVRCGGDAAVRGFTKRFDGVDLADFRVPPAAVAAAREAVDPDLLQALELANDRILAYHRHEPAPVGDFVLDGVTVRHLVRPVARAGLYAPGGLARYPSTVLMCAAPARVAGVDELVLCVPPGLDGQVASETLAAAAIAGIDEVYAVGGAQAVGAMAYGTETIRPVDVIVGPGNRYVAEAKRQVSGIVGVPSAFAGPSEVVVVADETTPVTWAAIDLVVQAEHGPDGLAWLVTWSESLATAVSETVEEMVRRSPRRAALEATMESGGYAVLVDGPEEAVALANVVAPEHLELMVEGAEALLPLVRCAGAVFLGPYAPASVGDYVAGPNHVLPTARTARFASALRVDDFRTHIHAVALDGDTLARLAPSVVTIAEAEGLGAHAESVRLRAETDPRRAGDDTPDRGRGGR